MKPNWTTDQQREVRELFEPSRRILHSALEEFCRAAIDEANANCTDAITQQDPHAEIRARLYAGQREAYASFLLRLSKALEKTSSGGPTA